MGTKPLKNLSKISWSFNGDEKEFQKGRGEARDKSQAQKAIFEIFSLYKLWNHFVGMLVSIFLCLGYLLYG